MREVSIVCVLFALLMLSSCDSGTSSDSLKDTDHTGDMDFTSVENEFRDSDFDSVTTDETVELSEADDGDETADVYTEIYSETTESFQDEDSAPEFPVHEVVTVPAGSFMMGCEGDEENDFCLISQKPMHLVNVPEFKLDKYEVTVGQYKKCIEAGVCNNNDLKPENYHYKEFGAPAQQCNIGSQLPDNHPASCINWIGAKAYCEWLGKRLPTEAEWEKAARGTDGRLYPWGDEPPSCDYAVIDITEKGSSDEGGQGCGTGATMAVGSKPAGVSPYGIHDMIGNVDEWLEDDWHISYDLQGRPDDGSAWIDTPRNEKVRAIRGTSWHTYAHAAFAHRAYYRSSRGIEGNYSGGVGFRCAE